MQIRELDAVADVHRGTHLSEGPSCVEPEQLSGQFSVPSGCPTGLQYGVSTYTARRELTYTVKG